MVAVPMNQMFPPAADSANAQDAIRGIDRSLVMLIAQRLQLTQGMNGDDALPLRPASELNVLRRLIAEAPQGVEHELIVEVWRSLIAASARRQRVVDVVVGGARTDPTRLFDIARRHFGARTRISSAVDPQAALMRAIEQPGTCVAVTPWPAAPSVGSWWPALSESRFHKLHLVAGLPVLGPASDMPEAAVFAVMPTEESGGDITLLMTEDPHHRAQRALNEVGLTGKEVARSEPRALIRVEAFLAANDPRARALEGYGLDRVRVLGSYARV